MKLSVIVKASAKTNRVEKIDNRTLKIFVKESPVEGRANRAVIEVLAQHFKIPKARVAIISGHKSKKKLIAISAFN